MIFYLSFLDFVFVCIECIFLSIFIFVLHMIFFCGIMDDGRPRMWSCFIMENEMTTIVAPPLLEGSLSSMVVAPTLLQYQLSNNIIRKNKNG